MEALALSGDSAMSSRLFCHGQCATAAVQQLLEHTALDWCKHSYGTSDVIGRSLRYIGLGVNKCFEIVVHLGCPGKRRFSKNLSDNFLESASSGTSQKCFSKPFY